MHVHVLMLMSDSRAMGRFSGLIRYTPAWTMPDISALATGTHASPYLSSSAMPRVSLT